MLISDQLVGSNEKGKNFSFSFGKTPCKGLLRLCEDISFALQDLHRCWEVSGKIPNASFRTLGDFNTSEQDKP